MTANYDNLTEEQEQYLNTLKKWHRQGWRYRLGGSKHYFDRQELNAINLEIEYTREFDPQYADDWQPLYKEEVWGPRF